MFIWQDSIYLIELLDFFNRPHFGDWPTKYSFNAEILHSLIECNNIHSMWTIHRMPLDADFPHPFNELFLRVYHR